MTGGDFAFFSFLWRPYNRVFDTATTFSNAVGLVSGPTGPFYLLTDLAGNVLTDKLPTVTVSDFIVRYD